MVFCAVLPGDSTFYEIDCRKFVQAVRRCPENSPAHQCGRVILLDVIEEAFRGSVPSACPDTALDLQCNLVLRYRIVKPPFPRRVESVLLDTLHLQVRPADDGKNIPYLWRIRRISGFLFPFDSLLIHLVDVLIRAVYAPRRQNGDLPRIVCDMFAMSERKIFVIIQCTGRNVNRLWPCLDFVHAAEDRDAVSLVFAHCFSLLFR